MRAWGDASVPTPHPRREPPLRGGAVNWWGGGVGSGRVRITDSLVARKALLGGAERFPGVWF